MQQIDLNADLGESYGPWRMGDDAALMRIITSANIACGGHAGDPETMVAAVRMALPNGVAIGAHPGYADRLGFGRRVIPMQPHEIGRMIAAQIGALQDIGLITFRNVRFTGHLAHTPHQTLGTHTQQGC